MKITAENNFLGNGLKFYTWSGQPIEYITEVNTLTKELTMLVVLGSGEYLSTCGEVVKVKVAVPDAKIYIEKIQLLGYEDLESFYNFCKSAKQTENTEKTVRELYGLYILSQSDLESLIV